MAGNRFRRRDLRAPRPVSRRRLWRNLRLTLRVALLGATLGALVSLGWQAVLRSPYFNVAAVDVTPTAHLARARILSLTGLDQPRNLLRFDARAAARALEEHPWVARANVETRLPGTVAIQITERIAAGALVLDEIYLVDASGVAFVSATADEASREILVTGIDRSGYEQDPQRAQAAVRQALAAARLYQRSPLSATRALGSVHVGDGGRVELQLKETRVVIGRDGWAQKLAELERIFAQLAHRDMEAAYILIADDLDRAIVRETPKRSAISASLRGK